MPDRYCFPQCRDPWFQECADCWKDGGNDASLTQRFQLYEVGTAISSYETWEEAKAAFTHGIVTKMMPPKQYLADRETGRVWMPGSRHEWEDAST